MWIVWMGAALGATDGVSLETWMDRLGTPDLPEACRVDASNQQLRIDCGGAALLMAPAGADADARQAALEAQLAPFADAGMEIVPPAQRSCMVGGVVRDCLEARVQTPGGPSMILISGMDPSASWVGTCLHRQDSLPEVWRSIFSLEPH